MALPTLDDLEGLRQAAGRTIYRRGAEYASAGMVKQVAFDGQAATGLVDGTHRYRTRIGVVDHRIAHDCSCPYDDGYTNRGDTHPHDMIDVLEPVITRSIDLKDRGGYHSAVELLDTIHRANHADNSDRRSADLIAKIRTDHKRKTNLMKFMTDAGLP